VVFFSFWLGVISIFLMFFDFLLGSPFLVLEDLVSLTGLVCGHYTKKKS